MQRKSARRPCGSLHFGSIEPKHEPEFWARIAGSQSGIPPWSRNSRRAAAGLT